MVKRKFEKPPCSEDELVDLLKKRGLSFQDEAKARRYLRFVGFYRLSGYMYPFQYKDKSAKDHHFRRLMSFDDILNIYIFDRDLKLLMTDALARIEVAFRAVLTNTMVAEGGPHWFLNSGFFKDTFDFEAHIEQCGVAVKQREKDLFIKHYHENYDEPELPPGWMMMEILPFGTLSRMCEKLEVDYRKKMAAEFNVHHKMLVQWMHAMVNLRNVCAHYGRLWNAQLGVLPKEIREHEDHFRFLQEGNGGNFYPAAVVTNLLLRAITQDTKWPGRFVTLVHTAMKNNPYITEKSLGMPPDWDQDTRLWP